MIYFAIPIFYTEKRDSCIMNIDYNKRKLSLANSRKAITEDEWHRYLETCYPEWWKSIYGTKWRINIIYYGRNDGHAD